MRNLSRIERSGFRRGEYVGYAGGAWRIRKHGCGGWEAFRDLLTRRGPSLHAPTLEALNAKLEALGEDSARDRSLQAGAAFLAKAVKE